MIKILHDSYKSVHIYKTLKKYECDFQLRPLIYKIHGNYIKTNGKILQKKQLKIILGH